MRVIWKLLVHVRRQRCRRWNARMPAAKLTTEENAAIAKLDNVLSAIFEEKKVRKDVQAILAYMEITDCETFSLLEESAAVRATGSTDRTWALPGTVQTKLQQRRFGQHERQPTSGPRRCGRSKLKRDPQASQPLSQAARSLR